MPDSSTQFPLAANRSALLAMGVIVAGMTAGVVIATGNSVFLLPATALLLVLRWPVQFALGAYAFVAPFEQFALTGESGDGGITPAFIAGLMAVATLVAVGAMDRRFVKPPRATLWWTLFIAWGTFTITWALSQETALGRLPTAISLLALYVLATSFRIREDEFRAVCAFTIAGGVAASLIMAYENHMGLSFGGGGRATLVFGGSEADPNSLAACLMVPFSLALGEVHERGGLRRTLGGLATAILVLGVVLTGSRGGMMGLVACLTVFAIRLKSSRRITVAVLVGIVLAVVPGAMMARLTTADRGAGRLDIWISAMKALPHYILQGAGWDNFPMVYTEYAGEATVFHGYGRAAHNTIIGLLLEVGALGVLFLFLAIRSQLRGAHGRRLVPFVAGCWGYMMTGMFLQVVWRKAFWLAWILLALATRLEQEAEQGADVATQEALQ